VDALDPSRSISHAKPRTANSKTAIVRRWPFRHRAPLAVSPSRAVGRFAIARRWPFRHRAPLAHCGAMLAPQLKQAAP